MIFNIADGNCFMPPVTVNQAENYTQYLHWNLPSDWLVHNTPSGYMDMDGWTKAIIIFSRTYGARNLNPQVILFGGHDRHLDDSSTHLI